MMSSLMFSKYLSIYPINYFAMQLKKNTMTKMTLNDNHSIILIIKNVVFLPDLYIYAVFVKILSVCKNYCLVNT